MGIHYVIHRILSRRKRRALWLVGKANQRSVDRAYIIISSIVLSPGLVLDYASWVYDSNPALARAYTLYIYICIHIVYINTHTIHCIY